MNEPLWYIETINARGNLTDISEIGFSTLEQCQAAIQEQISDEKAFQKKCMDEYTEELKAFVMDADCSDKEPVRPLFHKYTYRPKRYIRDERGYTDTE